MKKIKLNLYTIIFLFLTVGIYGQLQNANWYFGDQLGMDFNNIPPTVLHNGQTDINDRTASISDKDTGEILFYTNGHLIWDGNGQVISGSSDGFPSKTISEVIIIPFPSNDSKYIVFFSVIESLYYPSQNDYYYSIVNWQNGSGTVEILNNNSQLPQSVFSKNLVAARHSDGISFWIISITDDTTISCLLVDETGPSNTVISNQYINYLDLNLVPFGFSLSISQDDSKLAIPCYECYIGNDYGCASFLNLIDFDNDTGITTPLFMDEYIINFMNAECSEFSQNGDLLYVSGVKYNQDDTYRQVLIQIDISDITNYHTTFYHESILDGGASPPSCDIKIGMDEKIYLTRRYENLSNNLCVINNPNSVGSNCNFVEGQVDLSPNYAWHLPSNVKFHEMSCPNDLYIDEDVQLGAFDFQSASNSITAVNTIYSGATAEYDAGNFVLLDVGFYAQEGSDFYAYIDGCNILPPKLKSINTISEPKDIIKIQSKINIFPNPNNGLFTIDFPFKDNLIYMVEIYDSNFQIRANKKINKLDNQVDIGNLTDGFYYLKLFTDDGVFTKHFVIEN